MATGAVTGTSVDDVLAELAALEDPRIRAVNERHGDDHGVNLTKLRAVAKRLGNTKAVCRKCYVHPRVIDLYMDGSLLQTLKRRVKKELSQSLHGLPPEEAAVLALLQQRLGREERSRRIGDVNGRSTVPLSRLLRQSIKKKQHRRRVMNASQA